MAEEARQPQEELADELAEQLADEIEEVPEVPDVPVVPVDEARTITPFKLINRGEDTLSGDDNVVFSDFSPRIVPADTPDEVTSPKGSSAPGPAPSSGSTQTNEGDLAGTAKTPASKEDGPASPQKNG